MDNLSIVIPFYNGHEYINNLIGDIPKDIPVIVVDDLSDVPLKNSFGTNVQVVRLDHKGYFTGAVNFGTKQCDTDVLILNQDVRLKGTEWLNLLAQNREEYALIGERIKGSNPAWPNGYVHGVFEFHRRDAIQKVGLMDEENYPLWGASALWQLQICRQGFKSLPLETIPGLIHERGRKNFGSSIESLLRKEPQNKRKLVRVPPEISVIIPCYNHGKYLSDAVHSLIGGKTCLGIVPGQTFQSFEIIIINDGSTDNSAEVADSLADTWKGIRVIHQSNQGTAAAHNSGIKQAMGKYITCMSADDMREPYAIEILYQTIVSNPHTLVYDNPRILVNSEKGRTWPLVDYDFNTLLSKNMVPVGTMFEKRAWVEVGGYPEELKHGREDWGFAIAMGMFGYCGLQVRRPGYLYRQHEHNRVKRNTTPEWRNFFLSQMVQLFPSLYDGSPRMPGCCGGGRTSAMASSRSKQQSVQPSNIPGASGMTVLEYTGSNKGSMEWRGPSGTIYRFGDNTRDKRKLVDNQDVEWFLSKQERGKSAYIFRQPPVPELSPVPASAPVTEAVTETETQPGTIVSNDVEPEVIDPENFTIAEIKEMPLSDSSWEKVLDREINGLGRVTLIRFIKDKLAEIDG